MAGLTIEIPGLQQAIKDLRKQAKASEDLISAEIKATAFDIENDAKIAAPVDLANMRRLTHVGTVTRFDADILSEARYSPFVEFGTGGLVSVPRGLETYAIQFKGMGIRKVNLPARPFFFPAVFENYNKLVKRLQILIK